MNILILYHSRLGSVQKMARLIARGVESVEGCNAMLRSVPEIRNTETQPAPDNESGDAPIELSELAACDALILGSPTRFGNMSSALKHLLDSTSSIWMSGELSGKPAAVFTSSSSMHGGQESTLLSMMIPLLHHGMLITGIPFTEPALARTKTGGTPYGASHVAGSSNSIEISADERELCIALGKRVAHYAQKLAA
ncbi:NAD(P)H:quinone oxidoreductase [Arenicella xantha]|uniref:NAD(P)H dehydrogenase (Quinone) n=1 Tax=Arenicella xantha TaxID=644221 RepID=A0A395JLS4_9GAMM|nr:NAD(P)H:quinone oxidoreductase [Arenicella xantha]RBP51549.1 NAD(P)H dehydrogenase (quinone) [Arenicella xantha]